MPTALSISACFILLLSSFTNAHQKTFNLVAFPSNSESGVQVIAGDQSLTLKQLIPSEPYFTGTVEVGDQDITYKYVVDGKPETFARTLKADIGKTHNDFYGRAETLKPLTQLGWAFEGQKGEQWTRSTGQTNLFNETYLPTVHLTGAGADEMFENASAVKDRINATKQDARMDIFFVTQDKVQKFVNVRVKPTNTRFNKFQFRVKLGGKKKLIDGKNEIKFRQGENDPTLLRERLYTDLLWSVGAPTHLTNMARVYVNGKAAGFYVIQDKIATPSFVESTFYGNTTVKPAEVGWMLDATDSDLSSPEMAETFKIKPKKTATTARVQKLRFALQNLNPHDANAVDNFDKYWLDIDTLFKALALEYLTAHWDGYWYYRSNYMLVDDPTESTETTNRFYFLSQDLDMTFGGHLSIDYTSDVRGHVLKSYKAMHTEWNLPDKSRALVDKLILGSPALTERFETILKTIVRRVFNPANLNPRIDALAARYREEVRWDRALTRLTQKTTGKRRDYKWTLADFDLAIDRPIPNDRGFSRFGLKEWIKMRSEAVAAEFGIRCDETLGTAPYLASSIPPIDPTDFKVGNLVKEPVVVVDASSEDDAVVADHVGAAALFLPSLSLSAVVAISLASAFASL